MSDIRKVLVVGGGVGGMCLTICLQRLGMSVDLAEIATDWRPVGAGLTLNGATLRAFQKVGVLDQMYEEAHIHSGRRVFLPDGTLVNEVPAGVPEPGDLNATGGILRPVLHRILADRVVEGGANVRLGTTIESIIDNGEGVDVVFNDGSPGTYDLVVGADGLTSKVKSTYFPEMKKPTFTGQGCWRAVFDRPTEVECNWSFQDSHHKAGLNPVSKDKMYMFLLVSEPDNPWKAQEEWVGMLKKEMEPFGGLLADLRESLTEDNLINYRPLESTIVPLPWHKGRVVLIGDAVHPTTPHAAYGAGLAVEDAVVLSECLGEDLPVEAALQKFEQRRYERCKFVVEGSINLGRIEQEHLPVSEHQAAGMKLYSVIRSAELP